MTIIKKYNEGTSQWEAIAIGQKGDTGEGVPSGGSTGQVLAKASGTAYDTEWVSLVPAATAVSATGGTETTISVGSDSYKVHTFTSNGNFVVSDAGYPGVVEVLLVAGGGGGGNGFAGGGGAGGMVEASVTVVADTYPIVVGAGGTGRTGSYNATTTLAGGNGGDSTGLGLTAFGGGGGGSYPQEPAGRQGGSGGGCAVIGSGGAGVLGQGFQGGNARADVGTGNAGGGGGAGGPGGSGVGQTNARGAGGVGKASSISGTAVTYAAGGQGGGGLNAAGAAGSANTGNGGGGGGSSAGAAGGDGGSGIVIVRYKL
jgi:hypothetical protein